MDSYHICLPVEYIKDSTKSACATNRVNVPANHKKSPIVPGKLLPASRILWRSDPYEGHPPFEMHTQGTVPTHKMHNLDTAPMYKMHSIATSMFYDNLLLALIWFACLLKLNDSSLYPFFAKLKPQLSSAVFPLLLHPPHPPTWKIL